MSSLSRFSSTFIMFSSLAVCICFYHEPKGLRVVQKSFNSSPGAFSATFYKDFLVGHRTLSLYPGPAASGSDDGGKERDPKRHRTDDGTEERDVSDASNDEFSSDSELEMDMRGHRPLLDLNIKRIEDVVKLVDAAENIVVLSGAGVSVSCGVPDFRSAGGVYETVLQRYDLTDPQVFFRFDRVLLGSEFVLFVCEGRNAERIDPTEPDSLLHR